VIASPPWVCAVRVLASRSWFGSGFEALWRGRWWWGVWGWVLWWWGFGGVGGGVEPSLWGACPTRLVFGARWWAGPGRTVPAALGVLVVIGPARGLLV